MEAQPKETTGFSKQVIALSAKSPTATKEYARRLAAALENRPTEWQHVLHTMRVSRESFGERVVGVVETVAEAIAGLRSFAAGPEGESVASVMRPYRVTTGSAEPVFLFPGQGAQAVGMGQGLYRRLDHFRDSMNRCAEILEPLLGLNLCDLLYRSSDPDSAGRQLQQTRLTQPALFAIGYSLASQMSAWGCIPRYMLGTVSENLLRLVMPASSVSKMVCI